jgi:hypothetical protein
LIPKFLTAEQVSGIYRERIAALEALHLHALINRRVEAAHQGADHWDTENGRKLLETLHEDWQTILDGMAATEGEQG